MDMCWNGQGTTVFTINEWMRDDGSKDPLAKYGISQVG
jgi:hypothetical protein